MEVIGASCLSLIAGRARRRPSRFKYPENFHPTIRLPSTVDGGRGRSAFFRGGDCGDRPHKILVGPVVGLLVVSSFPKNLWASPPSLVVGRRT